MGFSLGDLGKVFSPLVKGGAVDELFRGIDDKLLGGDAEDAAREAAAVQAAAGREAAVGLQPFVDLGTLGTEQAGFLLDPQAQFDFLQNNPLFQLGLDNLNRQTAASAAASGRTGATDTSNLIFNNALLSASPLIQQQKGSIADLINLGFGATSNQGNLLTGVGAAEAGGIVGAANARQQGIGNVLGLLGQVGAAFGGTPGGTP